MFNAVKNQEKKIIFESVSTMFY